MNNRTRLLNEIQILPSYLIDKEFICKASRTVEEETVLIEAGFEYVCEIDDVNLFRKKI